MSIEERENYSPDGQSFQNEQYKNDDSVSNVLDNSINDDEQDMYNEEDDLEEDYKDADDLDPDDYEENDLPEEEEEDLDEEDYEENNFDETNLNNDINETDSAERPREF